MAGRISKTICFLILGLMRVTGGLNIYSQDCFEGRYCLSLIFNQGGSGSSNLTDAQNSCRSIGSNLAEISSSQIQSYVTAFLMNASSVIASNLAQKDVLVNAQSLKNETWYWVNGKPLNDSITFNSSHSVARIYMYARNYSYFFESASSPADGIGYICEYPNTSSKYNNCTFTDDDGISCFVVNNSSESWFSARNKCLWSNGDLASLDNIMANISSLQSPSASFWFNQTSRYWVGLRKAWWIWQGSKSEVKYTNWSSNIQPFNQSQECIRLSYTSSPVGQWMTFDCNLTSQFHYLCLYEKRNKTAILTKILTTAETVTRESTTPTSSARNNLALGLGVGLGLCVALLIIVVVVLVVIIIKRRLITSYDTTSQTSSSPANKGKRNPTNDSIPYYTQVAKHRRDGGGTSGDNSTVAAETATTSEPQTTYAEVRRNQTPSSPVAHGDHEERQPVYINVDIMQ